MSDLEYLMYLTDSVVAAQFKNACLFILYLAICFFLCIWGQQEETGLDEMRISKGKPKLNLGLGSAEVLKTLLFYEHLVVIWGIRLLWISKDPHSSRFLRQYSHLENLPHSPESTLSPTTNHSACSKTTKLNENLRLEERDPL